MTTARHQAGADAGFALIEALASLVIVGMMTLMLVAGVGAGRGMWERMDSRSAAGEAIEGAQARLRDRLERIYPATLYGGAEALADVTGDADGLVFLAPPDAIHAPGALRRYHLYLDPKSELVLASISDVKSPRDPGLTNEILLGGVQSLDIDYFGQVPPDTGPRWRPTWKQQVLPPQLIRVRISFERGDRRAWPELIVHPLANIDSGCILSAATSHCRGR